MTDRTKQGTGQSVAVSSKIWGLVGAVAFMLVVYVLPTPAPMERNGRALIGRDFEPKGRPKTLASSRASLRAGRMT